MITAMEYIHPISSVYRDGCDIAQRPPPGQFVPIAGYLIDEFAFPKPGRHGIKQVIGVLTAALGRTCRHCPVFDVLAVAQFDDINYCKVD